MSESESHRGWTDSWNFSERFYGTFERRISLRGELLEDKVSATYKKGVLSITLPKSERALKRARRIGRRIIRVGGLGESQVYPRAEHGMTEYELNAQGESVSTPFAPGYFQMMTDFIRDGAIGEHCGVQPSHPRDRAFRARGVP